MNNHSGTSRRGDFQKLREALPSSAQPRRLHHISLSLCAWCALVAGAHAETPPLSVARFITLAPKTGDFEIEGYVTSIYKCPECPPDSLCKPCMGEHVLLRDTVDSSDALEPYPSIPAPRGRILIFTKGKLQFEVKKRYVVKVRVSSRKTTQEDLNDLELLSAEGGS